MKIAMIGQYPPHIGGIGTHIHNLSKELVKNDDEVYVLTYPHKNIKEGVDNEEIHLFKTLGPNIGGLRSLFFLITGTIKLIKIIRKYNIDIIHGHYLFPAGLVAVLAGKFTNKKVYVTSHGSDISHLYQKYKFMRPILRYVMENVDIILVVSESLEKEILKLNIPEISEKIRIHWNNVDMNKFKPNNDYDFKNKLKIPMNQKIILYIGNLIDKKNVDILIKAKKQLKIPTTLIIVGNGPCLNDLKNMATDDIKKGDIIFTGARNDIEKIIPSADLLVLPSSSESFGLVLLEALACEKPVIGTNIGGIREIITENVGILVEPHNVNELTKAITLIFTDEKLENKFKENARKRAKKFSKMKIPY